jgi:quercetin dioxygenase-like cupin family protein
VCRRSDGSWRYAIWLLEIDEAKRKEAAMVDAFAVRTGEGEARWWLGALARIKATAADTGGHLTVVEVTDPPGVEAPLHVHHREDEAFWVLEGDVTFEVGGKTIQAGAGDFVFGPRDVPHRYTVGDTGSRMLFMLTPGGFEDLVRATSDPARSRTLPPADHPMPDEERMMSAQAAAGCAPVADAGCRRHQHSRRVVGGSRLVW